MDDFLIFCLIVMLVGMCGYIHWKTSYLFEFSIATTFQLVPSRIYKAFVFNQNDFPLKVILLNHYLLIEESLKKTISDYNGLFSNTIFFQLITVPPDSRKANSLYDGRDNDKLLAELNANVCIALVSNKHVHGKFEAGNADVLAHANMPSALKKSSVCLDGNNIDSFIQTSFVTKILSHELGHVLGLMDINNNDYLMDSAIGQTIMSPLNVCTQELEQGVNNPFDKESFQLLYPWVNKKWKKQPQQF